MNFNSSNETTLPKTDNDYASVTVKAGATLGI